MIPAILIWRDGHETEQSVSEGPAISVDGTTFHRVGMRRSRFLYVERSVAEVPEQQGDES